jgi:hypothetical protein
MPQKLHLTERPLRKNEGLAVVKAGLKGFQITMFINYISISYNYPRLFLRGHL